MSSLSLSRLQRNRICGTEFCGRAPMYTLQLLNVAVAVLFLFSAFCACAAPSSDVVLRSVVLDPSSGQLKVVSGIDPNFIAWAKFSDKIQQTGWSFLEVTTSDKYNDSLQAYAAGVVEAAVTQPLIYMHWMNTMMGYCGPYKFQTSYCKLLRKYIEDNLAWMEKMMASGEDPEYWHQVRLILLQLQGLEDSYNEHIAFPFGSLSLNPFGFFLFQIGGDLEDLESVLNKTEKKRVLGSGSCSALVKLLPGNADLLVSHDTWSSYQTMLRIVKKYNFAYRTSLEAESKIAGNVQAFSSYPGFLLSQDDFYISSSGLVTLETTIGNNNPALWKYVQPEGTVLEWIRNMVANRLASTGSEWASVFKRFNSGTYNNQWMIVDYKYFSPGKPVKRNLFTVLEQIPGFIVSDDKTEELFQKGYWASYNIAYFEDIFNASGMPDLVKKYGDWFTIDKNPRAQIFRRNQTQITDIESMIKLMRYNNFKNDPLSKCQGCDPPYNGENAISARSDLNPANGTYPFGALSQRLHGGTDMKITSFELYKAYKLIAISGPAYDEVPPFQWSTSPYKDLIHMGHPDLWQFPEVKVEWDW
ncbi:putative phospholipase B-like 2 [Protopterus annectens]|uniref:putative phospholipase B-like 2 n=1 Tax=Protopterus annectens TaxID=7888 RepID=UPI001CFB9AC0|nr:putative phospholipase B-like 2 [Protopterus annectens]